MQWNQKYRFKSYVRSSLWLLPLIAIPVGLLASRLSHWLDIWLGWRFLDLAVPGATALFQTVVTANLSFVVFTFGSLLVAIQVASGQLTPRIIATTLLRDNVVKYTVGLFILTLLFALSALDRMQGTVHQTVAFLAAILGIMSFVAFFYLIDYAARMLRPISVLTRVSTAGLCVIDSIYPTPSLGPSETNSLRTLDRSASSDRTHRDVANCFGRQPGRPFGKGRGLRRCDRARASGGRLRKPGRAPVLFCMEEFELSTTGRCAEASHSAPSALWIRILHLPFASSSTLRFALCHRQSTIRRLPYSHWISSSRCFEWLDRGTCARMSCETRPCM